MNKILNYCDAGNRAAIINNSGKSTSFRELFSISGSLVNFLEKAGVQEGDRVALQLEKRDEFLISFFSTLISNYIVVPINSSLSPDDIKHIHKETKPKYILNELPQTKTLSIEEIKSKIEKTDHNKISAIFFTSGTTNKPKGVCHTNRSLLTNALAFNNHVGIQEDVRMMNVMPVGYIAGMLNTFLCPIVAGGTSIVASQFSPYITHELFDLSSRFSANSVWFSPTMLAFLSKINVKEEHIISFKETFKKVFVGTAPLASAQKESFENRFGVTCLESFGMSEILLCASNKPQKEYKKNSAGPLLKDIEIKTETSDGSELKNGEEGSLCIKSAYSMEGYWDSQKEKSHWPFRINYIDSGDVGTVDSDGYLFITGRTKDLIIKGGVNISPRSIEEVLLKNPMIEDVAVIGIKHPFWGEDIIALVIPKDASLSEFDLKNYCKRNISSDSVPTKFIFVESFPRTTTGKIQKAILREKYGKS